MNMKDSGIAWIGMIPSNWSTGKLKFYLKRSEPRNPGNKQVLSLYRDYGVIPKDSRDDNHNVTSEDTSNYKYVKKGDFVINKMKAWQGSVAVSDYEGIVSPAYYVYKFTNQELNVKYFHYLLRSSYKEEFKRVSAGIRIGQWDLSSDDLEHSQILIPPLADQQEIANVLDEKLSNIDSVIDKTKQSITKLEEYKKSLITQAVTKGLDPNVEMKDSGVEWIGEIPKTWRICKFKNLGKASNGITYKPSQLAEYGIPVLRSSNIQNSKLYFNDVLFLPKNIAKQNMLIKGDILICSRNGSANLIGKSAYIEDNDKYCYGAFMMAFRSYLDKYGYYLLNSDLFNYYIPLFSTTTINQLTVKAFESMMAPLPPKRERNEIINYLDTKLNNIDNIIKTKTTLLSKLQEYKKALIFEYVTGKKSVKEI